MNFSIFYAQLIGFYFVIVAICMLVNKHNMHAVIVDLTTNKLSIILTGFLSLLFGLIMVLTHNVWVVGWPVIITLIGYLSVLRGIVRLYFTDWFVRVAPRLVQSKPYMVISVVMLILGIVLLYFGFAPLMVS